MSWPNIIPEKTLKWLLEPKDPGARYLALKQLSGLSENDPEIISAREIAHREGPIKTVLDAMHLDGYWVDDDPVYNPKYRSAVWALGKKLVNTHALQSIDLLDLDWQSPVFLIGVPTLLITGD